MGSLLGGDLMGEGAGMARSVLGLDVGGANLKAAHTNGSARSRPFALWKAPAALPDALRDLLRDWPPYEVLALTMTGELCDCFATKREGVRAILDAVRAVAGAAPVRVWRNDGRLVDLDTAGKDPLPVAAANWLALATFAGRQAPRGPALLIDIGSTTTDIVPLLDGRPVPRGRTDTQRLNASELAYTGVIRTPLCAILGTHGMAEFFATTRDIYLLLGKLPEAPSDGDTADGRPATRAAADARIARMIGADLETSTVEERKNVVNFTLMRQVMHIGGCIESVARRLPRLPETIVLSGIGEFLAHLVLSQQKTIPPCPIVSLSQSLGAEVSKAACAYALAVLAAEAG
jgi:probable H4MPT-linked C1 transfer pathway protein